MKKIFVFIAIVAIAMSCGITKYTTNDGYFKATGVAISKEKDMAYSNAYVNALGKINQENSALVNGNSVREYDSKTFANGKNIENFRREDFLTTKSQMSVSDVKVIKQKYRKVRKDGQKKIECELTVVVLKENIE